MCADWGSRITDFQFLDLGFCDCGSHQNPQSAIRNPKSEIEKMRRSDIAEGSQHGIAQGWDFMLQLFYQALNPLSLQVLLRAAQVARDDGIPLKIRECRDVRFPAVCQRTNHRVTAVVAAQNRRHRLQGPRKEEVQQKSLENIVRVMSQGDLGALFLNGRFVQDAPAQPGTQGTRGFPFLYMRGDDRIRVFLNDPEGHSQGPEVFRQDVLGKAGLFLIQVYRQKLETNRRAALQIQQKGEQRVAVLPAAQADHHTVSVLDHTEVADGPARVAQQPLSESLPGIHSATILVRLLANTVTYSRRR